MANERNTEASRRTSSLLGSIRRWAARVLEGERPKASATPDPNAFDSDRLQRLAHNVISQTGVPGIALSLIVDGQHTSAAAGTRDADQQLPLEPSTGFELAGLTKLVVAGVAQELARSARLDLLAPVARYLPDFNIAQVEGFSPADLLSHTSGYVGPNPSDLDMRMQYSWDDFLKFLHSTPQLYAPGTVFNLLDTETVVVGEIVRTFTGNEVADVAHEMFLNELLADGSEIAGQPSAAHAFAPQKGVFEVVDPIRPCDFWRPSILGPTMNIEQMARLGEMLLAPRSSPVHRPSAAPREQVVDLPKVLHGVAWEDVPASFGLGCAQFAPGVYGASSTEAGQCSAVRVLPAHGIVLAVALNASVPHVRDAVVAGIVETLTGIPRQSESARIDLDRRVEDLEGTYQAAESSFIQVSMAGDRVRIANVHDPWIPSEYATNSLVYLDAPEPHALTVGEDFVGPTVGVLSDPSSGAPCFMIGLSTYKKVA